MSTGFLLPEPVCGALGTTTRVCSEGQPWGRDGVVKDESGIRGIQLQAGVLGAEMLQKYTIGASGAKQIGVVCREMCERVPSFLARGLLTIMPLLGP